MLSFLALALLVAPCEGARKVHHASAAALRLQNAALPANLVHQWCALKDGELSCPEGKVISIYSAFYNRQKRTCTSPVKPKQPRSNCMPNVTDEYIAQCNGQTTCPRPVKEQPKPCDEFPWTGIRVRYSCNEGTAPPKQLEEVETVDASTCTKQLEEYESSLTPLGEQLEIFECECGMLPQDVVKDGKEFQVLDDTRICTEGCKEAKKPFSMLQLPTPSALLALEACPLPPRDKSKLRQLQAMRSLVGALQTAQDDCPNKKAAEEAAAKEATKEAALCPDPSMVRYDCGSMKTTQQECEASGCCWDPLPAGQDRPGRPWCYKARESVQCTPKCPSPGYEPLWREDCAAFLALEDSRDRDDAVREQACLSMGCCWQPLEHNSKEPWCFHRPCL